MKYFLVILTFILALLGLLKDHLPPKYKMTVVTLLIVFLVISAFFQIYKEYQSDKKEWQAKWSGQLRSQVKSQQQYPVLKLGGSGLMWAGEPNKPIIEVAGEPLTISLSDGRAQLSLVIRDKNGIVLAAIRNNEWFVAPPPVTLDRNFNENSLEVIDSKGEVIFQLQVYGEEVRLAGHFYSINGVGPLTLQPWLAETPSSGKLFKYPSAEHHGELDTK
jgi:hypothetical protein